MRRKHINRAIITNHKKLAGIDRGLPLNGMKQHYKKFIAGGVGIALWASAFIVFATEPAPMKDVRDKAQNMRQEVKATVKGVREEVQVKREELKKQLGTNRDEAKKRLEAAREAAKEVAQVKRENLKKRLGEIKDERKKERAARLDEQMNRLNDRWTTHFTNVLNKLEDILGKIQVRADKAAALGKDISAVKTATDSAKAVIASARTAVETQAKKDYTITFTSEEQLRAAFKAAKDQLHKDLTALRDGAIKNARSKVQDAARALGGVPKVDEEPETTAAPSDNAAPSGQ